jgi:hypothetical protein
MRKKILLVRWRKLLMISAGLALFCLAPVVLRRLSALKDERLARSLEGDIEQIRHQELNSGPSSKTVRRVRLRNEPGVWGNNGFILNGNGHNLIVFFPTFVDIEPGTTYADGLLYSDTPIGDNVLFDLEGSIPNAAQIGTWKAKPIDRHWRIATAVRS